MVAFSFILAVAIVVPLLPTAKAATWTVEIPGYTYVDQIITINVGDMVTWHNSHATTHSVTSNSSAWAELVLSPTQSGSFTFNSEGTFGYFCKFHPVSSFPNMWGEVRVVTGAIPEFSSASVVVAGLIAVILGLLVVRSRQ